MADVNPATRVPTTVEWSKIKRLLAAGNRLASTVDDMTAFSTDGVREWDRARYSLAPEQEQARRSGEDA